MTCEICEKDNKIFKHITAYPICRECYEQIPELFKINKDSFKCDDLEQKYNKTFYSKGMAMGLVALSESEIKKNAQAFRLTARYKNICLDEEHGLIAFISTPGTIKPDGCLESTCKDVYKLKVLANFEPEIYPQESKIEGFVQSKLYLKLKIEGFTKPYCSWYVGDINEDYKEVVSNYMYPQLALEYRSFIKRIWAAVNLSKDRLGDYDHGMYDWKLKKSNASGSESTTATDDWGRLYSKIIHPNNYSLKSSMAMHEASIRNIGLTRASGMLFIDPEEGYSEAELTSKWYAMRNVYRYYGDNAESLLEFPLHPNINIENAAKLQLNRAYNILKLHIN